MPRSLTTAILLLGLLSASVGLASGVAVAREVPVIQAAQTMSSHACFEAGPISIEECQCVIDGRRLIAGGVVHCTIGPCEVEERDPDGMVRCEPPRPPDLPPVEPPCIIIDQHGVRECPPACDPRRDYECCTREQPAEECCARFPEKCQDPCEGSAPYCCDGVPQDYPCGCDPETGECPPPPCDPKRDFDCCIKSEPAQTCCERFPERCHTECPPPPGWNETATTMAPSPDECCGEPGYEPCCAPYVEIARLGDVVVQLPNPECDPCWPMGSDTLLRPIDLRCCDRIVGGSLPGLPDNVGYPDIIQFPARDCEPCVVLYTNAPQIPPCEIPSCLPKPVPNMQDRCCYLDPTRVIVRCVIDPCYVGAQPPDYVLQCETWPCAIDIQRNSTGIECRPPCEVHPALCQPPSPCETVSCEPCDHLANWSDPVGLRKMLCEGQDPCLRVSCLPPCDQYWTEPVASVLRYVCYGGEPPSPCKIDWRLCAPPCWWTPVPCEIEPCDHVPPWTDNIVDARAILCGEREPCLSVSCLPACEQAWTEPISSTIRYICHGGEMPDPCKSDIITCEISWEQLCQRVRVLCFVPTPAAAPRVEREATAAHGPR